MRPLTAGRGLEGALFVTTAKGEPREFTYNRVTTPPPFLWRKEDLLRQAQRRLAASLLSACPAAPTVILCLAGEVVGELFREDLLVSVPVCRIADEAAIFVTGDETSLAGGASGSVHLVWFPRLPEECARERRLVQELARRGLLLEPFERAKHGLTEAYGASPGVAP